MQQLPWCLASHTAHLWATLAFPPDEICVLVPYACCCLLLFCASRLGIGEYIDDTEDYINIELDYNRNRLLRIEILLTVATFSLAIYNLVAGILGENLVLPSAWTEDIWGFIIINSSAVTLCTLVFIVAYKMMVKKKLI